MTTMSLLSIFYPIILASGLAGVPIAMPPLPEDPLLARLAPEECLWYFSSAGVATPVSDSKNATERLLAEPELQSLYAKLETQILAMMRAQGRGNGDELSPEIAKLVRVVATRPFAIYVGKVNLGAEGGPLGEAGIIANLGDNAAENQKVLATLEQLIAQGREIKTYDEGGITWRELPLPDGLPPVAWGVRGRYLLIGIGEKVGPAIIARARNNPPKWLSDLKTRLPIERPAVISYFNVAGARELGGPFLTAAGFGAFVEAFSVDQFQAVISVSGLDAQGCVSHTLVQVSESAKESKGLMSLASDVPLTADDVNHIPADATIAAALRLDGAKTFQWVIDLIVQAEPNNQRDVTQFLTAISQAAGADLLSEILPALGDVWTLQASPADGGFPWSGAVASVIIKDHATLAKVHEKVVQLVRQNMPDPPEDGRRHYATLRSIKSGAETVYFLNIVEREAPIAPAWCLTKDRLLIGLFPQSVKGALLVDSAEKRLPALPEVAAQLSSKTAPSGFVYVDTRSVFRTLYPALQIGIQMAAAEWQLNGLNVDVSVLPPARTIERHLKPSMMTFTRVADGVEFKRRQTLPGVSLTGIAPLLAGALVPVMGQTRGAAGENQDINAIKNLLLAMHNYHDINNKFPAARWGTKGNQGLSWRVAILPFIEEVALYDEFHHDEPWDSEHNLKLMEKMPEIYRSTVKQIPKAEVAGAKKPAPEGKIDELKYEAYRTPYLTLRHADSMFPPDLPNGKGIGLRDCRDGTSLTIAIVRATPESSVIWTKPDDFNFIPEKPFEGLMGRGHSFLAGFCDGHVQRIAEGLGAEMIKAMMTRNGGEPVDTAKMRGE